MIERLETRSGPELMRGRRVHEILFVTQPDARQAFMDGQAPTLDAGDPAVEELCHRD
jgi:hypothetical protein